MSTAKCKVLRFIHANGAQLQVKSVKLLVCRAERIVLAHIPSADRNPNMEYPLLQDLKVISTTTRCKIYVSKYNSKLDYYGFQIKWNIRRYK